MVSWKVTLSHIKGYIGASVRTFPLDFWPWSYRAESAVHSLAEDPGWLCQPISPAIFGGNGLRWVGGQGHRKFMAQMKVFFVKVYSSPCKLPRLGTAWHFALRLGILQTELYTFTRNPSMGPRISYNKASQPSNTALWQTVRNCGPQARRPWSPLSHRLGSYNIRYVAALLRHGLVHCFQAKTLHEGPRHSEISDLPPF